MAKDKANVGDKVSVHYTGKLKDGTIFDSSRERGPLEFTIGNGQLIPAFEEAVVGLAPGESTTTEISADQAYGNYRDDMIISVNRSELPPDIEPKIGDKLEARDPEGRTIDVVVAEVTQEIVKVDGNHPLAGKDLIFEIELTEVA